MNKIWIRFGNNFEWRNVRLENIVRMKKVRNAQNLWSETVNSNWFFRTYLQFTIFFKHSRPNSKKILFVGEKILCFSAICKYFQFRVLIDKFNLLQFFYTLHQWFPTSITRPTRVPWVGVRGAAKSKKFLDIYT